MEEKNQRLLLLSKFFNQFLMINLLFFFIGYAYDIIILIIYSRFDDASRIADIDAAVVQSLIIFEFVTFFIYYMLQLRKNREKDNAKVIRTWFFSYLILTLFWFIFTDTIHNLTEIDNADLKELQFSYNVLPDLYIILSAITVTFAIYQTAVYIDSKLMKMISPGYLCLPVLIVILRIPYETQQNNLSYWSDKIDPVTCLYHVQYIVWLFVLNIKVKNEYFNQSITDNTYQKIKMNH